MMKLNIIWKYNENFFRFTILIKPKEIEIPNIFDIYLFHNRSYSIYIYNLHFTHVEYRFHIIVKLFMIQFST